MRSSVYGRVGSNPTLSASDRDFCYVRKYPVLFYYHMRNHAAKADNGIEIFETDQKIRQYMKER